MKKKIKWGIVGPGKIAHSFAKDLKLVPGGELVAVASRTLDNALAFGKEYGASHMFGSYRELFECDEVDVVYMATPHTSHALLSIEAMEHGKSVLCEKPMGVNAAEVEGMIASARKNNVFLMEALWSRFNPSILKVKELVDRGELGDIAYVRADFGFYALDWDPEGRLLNPHLAGGSLLDIGIYPAFLAYLILGNPEEIGSSSVTHTNGTEVQTAMIFSYPKSHALLCSSLACKTEMKAEIAGSKGSAFLHPRWHETQGYSLETDGELTNHSLPTIGKGYSHEIEEVHKCLRNNQTESGLWSLQNSLDLIRILDKIRLQQGIVFPFEG